VKIIDSLEALNSALETLRLAGKTIGFVPTMGALHNGHMALITTAKQQADVVVASVFVNPTQFNNPTDLALYPRTPENDCKLLESNGCDIAFFPTVEEIYPKEFSAPFVPLGDLELVMEGKFRPGHFEGVVQVVYRLFQLVRPTKAFFGLKDFQQVAVIQNMVRFLKLPIEIVPCPTLRETSGLAMSSRNIRLDATQKEAALIIFQTLNFCKENASKMTPKVLQEAAVAHFQKGGLELEYLNIVDPISLIDLAESWVPGATACLACFCGDVRLIDNLQIIPEE
jgi:pantoate--beta-alanine ligase